MRGVLLWLIGIPIPIIILLYLLNFIELRADADGLPLGAAAARKSPHSLPA